jgi:hypothetical protein
MTLEVGQDGASVANRKSLTGEPALLISGDGVTYKNLAGGELIAGGSSPAAILQGVGTTLRNASGAQIRAHSAEAQAVVGSAETDTIINEGVISGGVLLGDGADRFVERGYTSRVDMGAGDDFFLLANGYMMAEAVEGGAGFDTVLLDGDYAQPVGYRIRGFERLELGARATNIEGYSGFKEVVLSSGGSNNFFSSANPLAVLRLVEEVAPQQPWGQTVLVGSGSSFRTVIGTRTSDSFTMQDVSKIVGGVSLGGGDDRFLYEHRRAYSVAPSIGGMVLGGAGKDRVDIVVPDSRTIDVGALFFGFEILGNGGLNGAGRGTRLSNADGFFEIHASAQRSLTLVDSDSPDANLILGRASFTRLELSVTVGSVEAENWHYSSGPVSGDQVSVIN